MALLATGEEGRCMEGLKGCLYVGWGGFLSNIALKRYIPSVSLSHCLLCCPPPTHTAHSSRTSFSADVEPKEKYSVAEPEEKIKRELD